MLINEDMGVQSCDICQIKDKKKCIFCYRVPTLTPIIFKNMHAGSVMIVLDLIINNRI